jgi:hypothetical protein
MDLSVLIPTSRRPHKLGAALSSLARQTLPRDRFEVLVGIDGPENGELEAVGPCPCNVTLLSFPRTGQAATRARLLEAAKGRFAVFIADSALCAPGLLAAHLDAQLAAQAGGLVGGAAGKHGVLTSGPVSMASIKPQRVIDRFIAGTRLFSGYSTGPEEPVSAPCKPGTFRAVTPSNMCVPIDLIQRMGGFCRQLTSGQYDAHELAWRLLKWLQTPIVSCPNATVELEERPDPLACYHRVITLGYESVQLAQMNPSCALDLLESEACGPGVARLCRTVVSRERPEARASMRAFETGVDLPTAGLSSADIEGRLARAGQSFEIARRWLWAMGQMAALDNQTLAATLAEFDLQVGATAPGRGHASGDPSKQAA